jgi:hypothetical protein
MIRRFVFEFLEVFRTVSVSSTSALATFRFFDFDVLLSQEPWCVIILCRTAASEACGEIFTVAPQMCVATILVEGPLPPSPPLLLLVLLLVLLVLLLMLLLGLLLRLLLLLLLLLRLLLSRVVLMLLLGLLLRLLLLLLLRLLLSRVVPVVVLGLLLRLLLLLLLRLLLLVLLPLLLPLLLPTVGITQSWNSLASFATFSSAFVFFRSGCL